jgi:hypothetical protein
MKSIWLAAILLADPRTVHAGSSCGGGGGGGNGGSSSGGSSSGGSSSGGGGGGDSSYSSSSDSYSSSDTSRAGSCIDDTDVHGFRHCTKFGTWGKNLSVPRLFIEVGTSVRNFESGIGERNGTVQHGFEQFSYRVVMPPSEGAANDVAATTNLRLGFGIGHGLYSGLEFEIGGVVAPAQAQTEMMTTGTYGAPNVTQQNALYLGFTGIGGYRVSGRRGSIALEGAGGLRSVRYHFQSNYHLCEQSTTFVSNRGVIEARARGELWLSPWLTAGVTLGTNVLDQGDWMAGLYLGAHSRAFAGTR